MIQKKIKQILARTRKTREKKEKVHAQACQMKEVLKIQIENH